jgi:plastocyanin domain-containing protein
MKTAFWIVLVGAAAAGVILIASRGSSAPAQPGGPALAGSNVTMENGVQVVEIRARGGYLPGRSVAKAGIPTIIRFKTSGTFDCSLAMRIPSKNISMFLPQTGSTDVDIGTSSAGTLQGMCSMGMYRFAVEFQ